jgi:murein L,D-transpeptidase YcbB/YkuD
VSVDDCKAYLLQALDGKWNEVSWHLTGDAFDCSPNGTPEQKALLEQMADQINSSGGEAKFLDSEHGDPAWHLQCRGGSISAAPATAGSGQPATASSSAQLYPGTLLREGSTGDDVQTWQQRLQELGYLTDSADGDFGPHTEAATRALQSAKGLSEDGMVGEHTWAAAWE